MRIDRAKQPLRCLLFITFAIGLTAAANAQEGDSSAGQAANEERIRKLEEQVEALVGELGRGAGTAEAEAEVEADPSRLAGLEEKLGVLADEIGRLETIFTVPEEVALTSFSGLGPAASKVYKRDSGLSIGGYGEVRLRSFVNQGADNKDDVFDALRAVAYIGYKFNDKWVLNSEFEFEHAGTGGGGSVSTEFVTLDYLHRDEFNLRAGLVLVPMGFINEIHEPNFFFGAERPEVERVILPSTWRENGVGIFGTIAERVHYRAYVINGFDGQDFTSGGLRGGRQKGSRAISNDFAFVARIDVDAAPGLLLGGSVYTGQTGQERRVTSSIDGSRRDLPDSQLTLYELHLQYKRHGLSVRALWTQAFLQQAGKLSRATDKGFIDLTPDPPLPAPPIPATRGFNVNNTDDGIASEMQGFYVEVAYDILPLMVPDTRASLEPYFRFEKYDTQKTVQDGGVGYTRDRSKDIDLWVVGLQFKPIPQVVFKVDYRKFEPRRGRRADEVQALLGYVF